MKAFVTYVRPILEYAPVNLSPYHFHSCDINKVEAVQRRFTKRLTSLRAMSYAERLAAINMDKLELRRLRFDLLFCYKIVFGLIDIQYNNMFDLNKSSITRGHCYKLIAKTSPLNARHHFYCNRIQITESNRIEPNRTSEPNEPNRTNPTSASFEPNRTRTVDPNEPNRTRTCAHGFESHL
jgi:hypothetical protein